LYGSYTFGLHHPRYWADGKPVVSRVSRDRRSAPNAIDGRRLWSPVDRETRRSPESEGGPPGPGWLIRALSTLFIRGEVHQARLRTFMTCVADHWPRPRAVGMPCAFSPAAMARSGTCEFRPGGIGAASAKGLASRPCSAERASSDHPKPRGFLLRTCQDPARKAGRPGRAISSGQWRPSGTFELARRHIVQRPARSRGPDGQLSLRSPLHRTKPRGICQFRNGGRLGCNQKSPACLCP
jgi:hypothetical protein